MEQLDKVHSQHRGAVEDITALERQLYALANPVTPFQARTRGARAHAPVDVMNENPLSQPALRLSILFSLAQQM